MNHPQLYLDDSTRRIILSKHRFYVEQVRKRLLAQFDDIEGQADQYQDELLGSLSQSPHYYFSEEPDLEQWAFDEAVGHYGQLVDLKRQVLLSSIAGMYHQWDKELREFLERELRHYVKQEDIDEHVWAPSMFKIFKLLKEFDWEVKRQPFFAPLDACGLLVNVYKHGKGDSLKRLYTQYPRYVTQRGLEKWASFFIDHRRLEVSYADFDEFAQAIDDFWTEMPERCEPMAKPNA